MNLHTGFNYTKQNTIVSGLPHGLCCSFSPPFNQLQRALITGSSISNDLYRRHITLKWGMPMMFACFFPTNQIIDNTLFSNFWIHDAKKRETAVILNQHNFSHFSLFFYLKIEFWGPDKLFPDKGYDHNDYFLPKTINYRETIR